MIYRVTFILYLFFPTFLIANPLTAANNYEVMKIVNENTVTMFPRAPNVVNHNVFFAHFNKDGHVKGQFLKKTTDIYQKDQGTWTVKSDGALCIRWDKWRSSKPLCLKVYQVKNGFILIDQETENFEGFILITPKK